MTVDLLTAVLAWLNDAARNWPDPWTPATRVAVPELDRATSSLRVTVSPAPLGRSASSDDGEQDAAWQTAAFDLCLGQQLPSTGADTRFFELLQLQDALLSGLVPRRLSWSGWTADIIAGETLATFDATQIQQQTGAPRAGGAGSEQQLVGVWISLIRFTVTARAN